MCEHLVCGDVEIQTKKNPANCIMQFAGFFKALAEFEQATNSAK